MSALATLAILAMVTSPVMDVPMTMNVLLVPQNALRILLVLTMKEVTNATVIVVTRNPTTVTTFVKILMNVHLIPLKMFVVMPMLFAQITSDHTNVFAETDSEDRLSVQISTSVTLELIIAMLMPLVPITKVLSTANVMMVSKVMVSHVMTSTNALSVLPNVPITHHVSIMQAVTLVNVTMVIKNLPMVIISAKISMNVLKEQLIAQKTQLVPTMKVALTASVMMDLT